MKVDGQPNEQSMWFNLLAIVEEERTQVLEQASNENNTPESENLKPSVPDDHPFSNILNLRLNFYGRFPGRPPVFVLKNSDQ